MRTPTPGQREKWRKIQAQGKLRFVLLRGILGWGLPTMILVGATDYYLFKEAHSALNWLLAIPIWLFGGYFFGLLMWRHYEAYFSR